MVPDRLQLQRFELKYVVCEEIAHGVRDFVRAYLEIDEYGATQPNLSYAVHSLYLDSDDLATYWHTINGNKNRFKLRLRFYDDLPSSPVYFEIKRRFNNTIKKQRGGVRREAVEPLLAGHLPDPQYLVSHDPKHLLALNRFCQILSELRAKPKAHVAYLREAWMSPEMNSIRVTMDREVRFEPQPQVPLTTRMRNPVLVFGKNVVLELKFTDRFPGWMKEMVRVFGLTQCSAAKYVDGVVVVGDHAFNGARVSSSDHFSAANSQARRQSLVKINEAPMAVSTA